MRPNRILGDSPRQGRPFSIFRLLGSCRRRGIPGAALIAGLLATAGCGGGGEPWNVLLITIDTLRADRLGCYGGNTAMTPNIDRLAREGSLFGNSFAAMPITLPSHATILTGLYPRHHGVLSHAYTLDPAVTTFPEILRARGYQTVAFVSSHVLDTKYGIDQGFDLYWKRYDFDPEEAKRIRQESGFDILTEAVEMWADFGMNEPFFAWVHWFHPHKPYEPPPPYDLKYARGASGIREMPAADVETLRRVWEGEIDLAAEEVAHIRNLYDGEVSYTDRQVGLILRHLADGGHLDRTIVIVTADHGEMLYEKERYFGHDIMLYDPSIRVPLILWAPGLVPGGQALETTVRSVDLVPTLLDLLGIDDGGIETDGRSFAPALRGKPLPDAPGLAELFPPREGWKSEPGHSVQLGEWKLIRVDGEDQAELYRLDIDPAEAENLAGKESRKLAEMERVLEDLMDVDVQLRERGLTAAEVEMLKALGYIGN